MWHNLKVDLISINKVFILVKGKNMFIIDMMSI